MFSRRSFSDSEEMMWHFQYCFWSALTLTKKKKIKKFINDQTNFVVKIDENVQQFLVLLKSMFITRIDDLSIFFSDVQSSMHSCSFAYKENFKKNAFSLLQFDQDNQNMTKNKKRHWALMILILTSIAASIFDTLTIKISFIALQTFSHWQSFFDVYEFFIFFFHENASWFYCNCERFKNNVDIRISHEHVILIAIF